MTLDLHITDSRIPENCALSHQDRFAGLYDSPVPGLDGPRTTRLLNSGLVVLHPSEDTMNEIIHFLGTSSTIATSRFPDQDVLAEMFKGRWRPLPWWTNALKTERAVHPDVWADSEVRLIHFMYVARTLAKLID